jgi:hypothetical protein
VHYILYDGKGDLNRKKDAAGFENAEGIKLKGFAKTQLALRKILLKAGVVKRQQ